MSPNSVLGPSFYFMKCINLHYRKSKKSYPFFFFFYTKQKLNDKSETRFPLDCPQKISVQKCK